MLLQLVIIQLRGVGRVPIHNAHPTATISLKAGDNVSGNTVAVDGDEDTTNIPATFTILVTFSADVSDSSTATSVMNTGDNVNALDADLNNGITTSLLNTKNTSIDITSEIITRTHTTGTTPSKRQFQIVVTPNAYPERHC